jgi:hypothetical protein
MFGSLSLGVRMQLIAVYEVAGVKFWRRLTLSGRDEFFWMGHEIAQARTLASRTQRSTQEIQAVIERLRAGSSNTLGVMAAACTAASIGSGCAGPRCLSRVREACRQRYDA